MTNQKRTIACLTALITVVAMHAVRAATATRVRVEEGRLLVTVDGRERSVANNVSRALIIESGNTIVYADKSGGGGYENEGQTLFRYAVNAPTQPARPLLSEGLVINRVQTAYSRGRRLALLVSQSDGGAGIPTLAVVHPTRGRVWSQRHTRLANVRNGRITVFLYQQSETGHDAPPLGTANYDLERLLSQPARRAHQKQ